MQSLSMWLSTLEIELRGELYPKILKALLRTGQASKGI